MFSDQAWQIQLQSSAESKQATGTAEQLLLGFLNEPSGTGRAALRNQKLDVDRVRAELVERLVVQSRGEPARAKTEYDHAAIINRAAQEARALSHEHVVADHLLLALLYDEGIAGPLLREFGVTIASGRRAVARALAYPLVRSCALCTRLRTFREGKELVWVAELTRTVVLLGDNQGCKGWCTLVLRGHAEHVADMPTETQLAVWDDVSRVASAIRATFPTSGKGGGPPRINYECLGNLVPHVHWHIIPRHADDPDPTKPVWGWPEAQLKGSMSHAERAELIMKLREHL